MSKWLGSSECGPQGTTAALDRSFPAAGLTPTTAVFGCLRAWRAQPFYRVVSARFDLYLVFVWRSFISI